MTCTLSTWTTFNRGVTVTLRVQIDHHRAGMYKTRETRLAFLFTNLTPVVATTVPRLVCSVKSFGHWIFA